MSTRELGSLTLALLLLLLSAHLLGAVFARLRQPKLVGEILAGILLGPSLLGYLAPGTAASIFGASDTDGTAVVLSFFYNIGLLLLMFVSGISVRYVLGKDNRRATAWILGLGTTLPFLVALALSPAIPVRSLAGPAGTRTTVVLIVAIATAVTSIPVIARIFHDLGILHTRFASLMLGMAVLEDIVLWAVLAAVTALAGTATPDGLVGAVSAHAGASITFIVLAVTVAPIGLSRLSRARWNVVARETPVAWIFAVLLAYVSIAAALDIAPVFAAFLAGFGIVGGARRAEHQRFRVPLDSISSFAAAVFVPVYFALVGYRLNFRTSFSAVMLVAFLLGSSALRFGSVGLAGRFAGFRGRELVNVAITANARGGPGIVLASVAFDAGIINARFFTTLVLTALLTSEACGIWLDRVLRAGKPLLASEPADERAPSSPDAPSTLGPTAPAAEPDPVTR